ncbi:unnamed protein product [Somion occarium]|uniref:PDZ GRASP-type domain-containing protein n=1 Tax=Somion occarium TaxID=3059160 RepID=A0ABP1DZZ6_9APHY
MGASQSSASQAPSRGLHVLRVTPSSPASQTNIEPFFDFIVGFKGDSLAENRTLEAAELEKIVESHEGRTLNLVVWNSKNQNTRIVPIVPSREWSLPHTSIPDPQEPEAQRKPSLLGLSMRMCEPETSLDNVWHVLDVLEGSPAESAGLVPYGDWIIGWSGGVLSAEGDFYDVVEAHIEKPLRVYVYSYDFDTIREVVLVPNRHWGGEGLLGCVFGFGLLHRIPAVPETREPGSIPEELLEPPDEYEEQQLFVPADYADEPELPEHAEARIRWEQEEWEREAYARNYMHDSAVDPAANHTSSSAYDDSAEFDNESHSTDNIHNHSPMKGSPTTEETEDETGEESYKILAPTPVRPALRQDSVESTIIRIASSRSSSFSVARASTPTPTRPFGSFVNGIGLSPRTLSWDHRTTAFDLSATRQLSSSNSRVANSGQAGDDDDDLDGTLSVAGTDFTELSETTSNSLTSVD